jgi:hypothetical protein
MIIDEKDKKTMQMIHSRLCEAMNLLQNSLDVEFNEDIALATEMITLAGIMLHKLTDEVK